MFGSRKLRHPNLFEVANCDFKLGRCKKTALCFHRARSCHAWWSFEVIDCCAKQRIILIDNYVDESVLTLLDKREDTVSAIIYTQQISRQLRLDVDRHNSQYPPIEISVFRRSHDRFLCIDDTVYHVGASIKDLGKKWFAFSKMEDFKPEELVAKINEAF